MRAAGPRWARDVALPEIARLVEKEDDYHAFLLARQAQPHLPGNAALQRFWIDHTFPLTVETNPPGAERPDEALPRGGRALGAARPDPLQGAARSSREPAPAHREGGVRARSRSSRTSAGACASVASRSTRRTRLRRGWSGSRGGSTNTRSLPSVELGDFWLDRYEVTNRQYKEFVDQGAYRSPAHWKEPFVKGGRVLAWEEAMALFRDSTGRPGPATWEVGTYPDGQADHPVGGVSWFEAAAYARFAGKELPTVHHWMRAAGDELLRRHPAPQQLRRPRLCPGGEPPGPVPLRRLRPGRQRQGVVLERGPARSALHPRRRLERAELRVRRPGRHSRPGTARPATASAARSTRLLPRRSSWRRSTW